MNWQTKQQLMESYKWLKPAWTKQKMIEKIVEAAQKKEAEAAAKAAKEAEKAAMIAEREQNGVALCRMSDTPDESCLEYPYGYSKTDSEDDVQQVLGYPVDAADVIGFPANVKEYYWIRPGQNDGDHWLAFGQLDSGVYFYYKAWCDYTGFDCQGGVDLYAANHWEGILTRAMSAEEYIAYQNECKVPV